MRYNKTYTIDEDLILKLGDEKNGNVSELINTLIRKHYCKKGSMSEPEIKREIEEAQLIISEKTSRLEKLDTMLLDVTNKELESQTLCMKCKKPILEGDLTNTECNSKGETISITHQGC